MDKCAENELCSGKQHRAEFRDAVGCVKAEWRCVQRGIGNLEGLAAKKWFPVVYLIKGKVEHEWETH